MITDEERRQIAYRLHEEAENWRDFAKDDTLFDMCDATFVESMLSAFQLNNMDMHVYKAFEKLADLIDRPTCYVVERKTHCGSYGCEEAGQLWVLSCGDECVNDSDFPPRYCPECGAMVVEKEQDDDER